MKNKINNTIVIGGYYGAHNLGDEAILEILINKLQWLGKITIISHSPEITKRTYKVHSIWWRDIPAIARAVMGADIVIIGGGGIFMDYWGIDENSCCRITHGGITTYGTLALLAETFGVPYVVCGVGIGPLESKAAQEQTCKILSAANKVVLRDTVSLNTLKNIKNCNINGTVVASDIVFALKTTNNDTLFAEKLLASYGVDLQKPLLGVSVRFWDIPFPPERWVPSIARGIRKFVLSIDAEVLLIPFQVYSESKYTDDLLISQMVAREINLPDKVFILEQDLSANKIQAVLGKCDIVLGMRFHSVVMSINSGVPVVALTYDPKVASLMSDAGLGDFNCRMSVEPLTLTRKLSEAYQKRSSISEQLQEFQDHARNLAKKGLDSCIDIIGLYHPKPSCETMGNFIIERLDQMQQMDTELLETRAELLSLRNQVSLLGKQLYAIKTSRTYKVASYLHEIWETLSSSWRSFGP